LGEEIEIDSVELGHHELGDAWVTEAGPRAPAKFVIHVAAMDRDKNTSEAILQFATAAALHAAETRRVTSVAFSALGTGSAQHPPEAAGGTIGRAVAEHIRRAEPPSHVKDVVFVVLDKQVLHEFEAGLRVGLVATK